MSENIDRSYDAQLGVIGSLMLDAPRVAGEVFRQCRSEHFTDAYRTLFDAAKKLQDEGKPIDPITIRAEVGDAYTATIVQIMDLTPTAANCSAYISALLDLRQLEKLREAGAAMSGAVSVEDAQAAMEMAAQAMVRQESARVVSIRDCLAGMMGRERPNYISWGVPKLDREVLSEKGDFVVIGGRPSAGKTALSLQFAWHQARELHVGYFSLETSPDKIAVRIAAMAARVDFGRLKRQDMEDSEFAAMAALGREAGARRLDIVHAAGMTVSEVAAITAAKRFDIIYIDYLQLLRADDRAEDLFSQVTKVSMALHTIAQTHGVMIVALSQLSRPDQASASKAPTMASLRQSGQIEQDADAVMLLYLAKASEPHGKRRLSIAKNKEGPSGGYFDLDFEGRHQRFVEVAQFDAPAEFADAPGEPVPF